MQRLFKEGFILAITAIAGIYLLNPTAGFLEFLPDALPLVGNLDEIAATAIILNTLRYYGIDVTTLWSGGKQKRDQQVPPPYVQQQQTPPPYSQQQDPAQQLRDEQERAKRR